MNTFLALAWGAIMGLAPTFGLLFIITSHYEKKIEEEDTMKTYIIGLLLGIVVIVSHLFFISDFEGYAESGMLLISAYLLALGEMMLWHIFINRRKTKGRSDIPFLLLSFSLGISGMYILFTSGQMLALIDARSDQFLGMILFAFAVSLMRGSMAIYLSRGELKRKVFTNGALITLVLGTFNLFSFMYLGAEFLWTFSVILVIPALISFYLMYPDLAKVSRLHR
ncbi:MAG: hypothetical protein U9R75_05635 [Candidatus Thermoplasmatota archaeon]|nr:hypothetical protein [Candidatus Thermoplasmatota archaeon]